MIMQVIAVLHQIARKTKFERTFPFQKHAIPADSVTNKLQHFLFRFFPSFFDDYMNVK